MELITNILIEYLKHNKRLVVPKLGAFIVKQSSQEIIFSELMRNDDGVLRSLLVAYGVKELEAAGIIDRLVFEVRHAVSMGESYTIENFGTFSAGANNTIIFKYKREPQKIGGRIKPPVETLTNEKVKLQRRLNRELGSRERTQSIAERDKRDKQSKKVANKMSSKTKADDEDSLQLGKQEAYLRGLKYDKNNNKRRGEERHSEGRGGHTAWRMLLMLIVVAIICALGWFAWQWFNATPASEVSYEPMTITEEQCVERDTLATDSLCVDSAMMVVDMATEQVESRAKSVEIVRQPAEVVSTPREVTIMRDNNTENR